MKDNTKNDKEEAPNPVITELLPLLTSHDFGLDLGCGTGRDSRFIMAHRKCKIILVDASEKHVLALKRQGFDARVTDIATYNIEKNAFDFIICLNVLHFFEKNDYDTIIKRVKEGLKKNGIAVISAFTENDPSFRTTKRTQCYYLKPDELKELFADFQCLYYSENTIRDPGHPGKEEPHTHEIATIIAKK